MCVYYFMYKSEQNAGLGMALFSNFRVAVMSLPDSYKKCLAIQVHVRCRCILTVHAKVFQFSLFISFNAFNVFINALNKRFTNDLAYNAIGQDNIYQMI